jgi:hypothetical protein
MTHDDLIAAILARHARYGWTADLNGEWDDIQWRVRKSYRARLGSGDPKELGELFASLFRSCIVQGLISYDLGDIAATEDMEALARSLGQNAQVWFAGMDPVRDAPLEAAVRAELANVRAPTFGAPVTFNLTPTGLEHDVVPVMFDTIRHDWYARRCLKLCPDGTTLLEIGAGYGGVVWQMFRRGWNGRAVLCDIPETLYAAFYFLSRCGLTVRWHDEPLEGADVVLLPAKDYATWTAPVHLVFAAHSLSEMDAAVGTAYVRWIEQALRPRWVYYDASRLWAPEHADPESRSFVKFPELLIGDIAPRPPYQEVFSAPITWAQSGDRYCEYLYMDMAHIDPTWTA